jgi:hypothetical protein
MLPLGERESNLSGWDDANPIPTSKFARISVPKERVPRRDSFLPLVKTDLQQALLVRRGHEKNQLPLGKAEFSSSGRNLRDLTPLRVRTRT